MWEREMMYYISESHSEMLVSKEKKINYSQQNFFIGFQKKDQ